MARAESASSGRLLTLDAMRGVAALVVVLHHVEQNFQIKFGSGFAYGYIAVDVFFLMSGYVIAHAYEGKMTGGQMSVWRFFLVRMQRLYPLLAFGALLGAVVAIGMGRNHDWPLATLSSLVFVPLLWSDMAMYPINPVQWSVSIEIIVNMLHRLLVKALSVRALAVLAVLCFALTWFAAWHFKDVSNGWARFNFWAGIPRAGYSYFIGVLVYRLTVAGKLKAPSIPAPWIFAALVGLVMLEPLVVPAISHNYYWLFVVGVVFPPMLVLLVNASLAPRLTGAARALGDISYPLYAVHGPLIVVAAPLILKIDNPLRAWATLLLVAIFALIALALDRVYDRPVRARLARRRPEPEASESAAP